MKSSSPSVLLLSRRFRRSSFLRLTNQTPKRVAIRVKTVTKEILPVLDKVISPKACVPALDDDEVDVLEEVADEAPIASKSSFLLSRGATI